MREMVIDLSKEEWRCIGVSDFSCSYEVSNFGRIRNSATGRYLTPEERNGYSRVSLVLNGKRTKKFTIHRLVLMTFNPVEGMDSLEVDHIDGDKGNNVLSNLRWVNREENLNNPEELSRREMRKRATQERREAERAKKMEEAARRKEERHQLALDRRKDRRKEYYQEHKEEELENSRLFREANPEYFKEWKENNRERYNSYARKYYREKVAQKRKARLESLSAEEREALREKQRANYRARKERNK